MKVHAAPAPGAGTGLFASLKLDCGTDIFTSPLSFVAVLDTPRLEDTCSNCFGKKVYNRQVSPHKDDNPQLKACLGCKVVKYCDKNCQVEHWRCFHKYECSLYKKLYPKILPSNARALVQIISRLNLAPYETDVATFKNLETHWNEVLIRQDEDQDRLQRIILTAQAIQKYSGTTLSLDILASYLAKLEINCFTLTTPFNDTIGLSLIPFASLINHNCDPNAVVVFDGPQMYVKVFREITSGEQIFISYIDNTNTYQERQAELESRYFFKCHCSRCSQDMRKLKSPHPHRTSDTYEEVKQNAHRALHNAGKEQDPSRQVDIFKASISFIKEKHWPITRQPYVEIQARLLTSLLEAEDFRQAFIQSAIRYFLIDLALYPEGWHPIKNLHAFTLSELCIYLSDSLADNRFSEGDRFSSRDFRLIARAICENLKPQFQFEVPTMHRVFKETLDGLSWNLTTNGANPLQISQDSAHVVEELKAYVTSLVQ